MRRMTLLKSLGIGSVMLASCGIDSPAPQGHRSQDSVLASLGGIETKPDGVDELVYELELVTPVSTNIPPPVIGTIKNTGGDALIEFKRTAENPLAVGSSYRLTVVGITKTDLYEYLDKPRTSDGKSIYHKTSVGKISNDNSLKLTSVKRYNAKGAALFSLTVKAANPDIGINIGAKAQLTCGAELLGSDMSQTTSQFVFNFNTTHFLSNDPLICTQLTVSVADKIFVNKSELKLTLVKQSASLAIDLTLEEKRAAVIPADTVAMEIVNALNGVFVGMCDPISAQPLAPETFKTVTFEFKMTAGDNKGTSVRTVATFLDKDCKIVATAPVQLTNYAIELLDPSLVIIPNTLPITFTKITGAERVLETHTIVNVTDNKLRFGAMVQGSEAWSGSKDLAALPDNLSVIELIRKLPQQ